MTKSDWACGIAAAMIGGALLAFQFFILLREDVHPCMAIGHSMVMAGDCNGN